jgi:hypothetical protein
MCSDEGNLSVWHATTINKDNHKMDANTYTLPTLLAIRDVQISNTPHSESGLLSFGTWVVFRTRAQERGAMGEDTQ